VTPHPHGTSGAAIPLFVDLDGTLVKTDLLYESFLDRLKRDWALPVRVLSWLVQGKAQLKAGLAQGYQVPSASLPYNHAVLDSVRQARADGRPVYLATASHVSIAQPIAEHLGLFDGVIASDQGCNLSGAQKLVRLREVTGSDHFEYLGNSGADIPIWDACAKAGVVQPDEAARKWLAAHPDKASSLDEPARSSANEPAYWRPGWQARWRLLRPHQWLKNLLLLLPLVAAHRAFDPASLLAIALAFVAFSLCASAVYVVNDMLDLSADRAHPRKRLRPFASGAVPLSFGFKAAPLLLLGAFGVGALVNAAFLAVLGVYLVMTCAYSLSLKRKMAIDVLMLAALYTIRIGAGTAALAVLPSHWLLGFSTFLFFGLALVKRSSELMVAAEAGKPGASGRNYLVEDLPMVNAMGIASSYLSVLVLALYISGPDVSHLYAHPYMLWLLCPLLLYWLTRLWLITRRGGMHDDPVVYAARDGVSHVVALCGLVIVLASAVRWA
jgi:4-hydroxybenzoate polyprenyltransferase/phosphoserine phosphatase